MQKSNYPSLFCFGAIVLKYQVSHRVKLCDSVGVHAIILVHGVPLRDQQEVSVGPVTSLWSVA